MVKQREKIEQRLKKMGKGWAFSRKDLRDIAPSGAAGVVCQAPIEMSGVCGRLECPVCFHFSRQG